MKQQKVRAILDKKMSELNKLSGRVAEKFDADVIHDLRVVVKSLRAFMRMLAEANDEQFKLPKKFKSLYHTAGIIRESQLELEKIKEAQYKLPKYERHLNEIIRHEIKEWEKSDIEVAVDKLERRVGKQSCDNLNTSTLKRFIGGKLSAIHALCVNPVITDDMMHSMRKELKDAMYVVKSIRKEDQGLVEDLGVELEQLDYNSQLLGDYNDARIMLGHMAAFVPMCTNAGEKQRITGLYEENKPKLQNEKTRIINELLMLTHQYAITGSQTGIELPKLSPVP